MEIKDEEEEDEGNLVNDIHILIVDETDDMEEYTDVGFFTFSLFLNRKFEILVNIV